MPCDTPLTWRRPGRFQLTHRPRGDGPECKLKLPSVANQSGSIVWSGPPGAPFKQQLHSARGFVPGFRTPAGAMHRRSDAGPPAGTNTARSRRPARCDARSRASSSPPASRCLVKAGGSPPSSPRPPNLPRQLAVALSRPYQRQCRALRQHLPHRRRKFVRPQRHRTLYILTPPNRPPPRPRNWQARAPPSPPRAARRCEAQWIPV
jgi:hypothetical protein